MKIALIKDKIPFPCANVINTLKHAQAFYNLGKYVEVLAVESICYDFNSWESKRINY